MYYIHNIYRILGYCNAYLPYTISMHCVIILVNVLGFQFSLLSVKSEVEKHACRLNKTSLFIIQ